MKHLILLEVDSIDGLNQERLSELVNEVQSNLEWLDRDYGIRHVTVVPTPTLVEDLTTLYTATQNITPSIECAAALANFSHELLTKLGVDIPREGSDFDEDGETDLSKFTHGR